MKTFAGAAWCYTIWLSSYHVTSTYIWQREQRAKHHSSTPDHDLRRNWILTDGYEIFRYLTNRGHSFLICSRVVNNAWHQYSYASQYFVRVTVARHFLNRSFWLMLMWHFIWSQFVTNAEIVSKKWATCSTDGSHCTALILLLGLSLEIWTWYIACTNVQANSLCKSLSVFACELDVAEYRYSFQIGTFSIYVKPPSLA